MKVKMRLVRPKPFCGLGFFVSFPKIVSIMEFPPLSEYRCDCGKLLFKGSLLVSVIEVKCKRCGEVLTFKGKKRDEDLLESILLREKRA